MRTKHSKVIMTLLAFTMCLTILAPAVFAEEAPSVEIPVTVKSSGSPPTDDEDYKIVLESDNADYPMPVGSEDGIFSMIITGENTIKMPNIQYSSLGIYTYTIYQIPGSNKLATYDDTKYNLVVYVTNAEAGSGLETTVILYLLGETDKHDEVIFNNEYEKEITPSPPDKSGPPGPETLDRPQPPQTSDDNTIWPYVGLFISGAAMIFILGMTIKKKNIEE